MPLMIETIKPQIPKLRFFLLIPKINGIKPIKTPEPMRINKI